MTVKKYNDGNWETIGSAGFSEGESSHISLFAADGVPYVSYRYGGEEGQIVVMTANKYYNVIYDGNHNTDGNPPTDGKHYNPGDKATVLGPHTLKRYGYEFTGWNTSADGSGTGYNENDEFIMGANDVILYAQWNELHVPNISIVW